MESSGEDLNTALQPSKKVRVAVGSSNAGKATVGNKNPLEIPEIVAIVIGHISDVEDLKCVRGLNKMWRDEAFLKWRNTAVFLINYKTIPILLEAFDGSEEDLANLSEAQAQKAEVLARKDPFRLKQFPFKKYRFAKSQGWMYPLDEGNDGDSERKLIWEKCINPNAAYLDVGECILKTWNGLYQSQSCLPGLRWILCHSPNVTDFAMAPLVMYDDRAINPDNDKPSGDKAGQHPIWFQDTFEASHVNALTFSASQEKSGFLGDSLDIEVMARIFCMLPSLKTLNVHNIIEDMESMLEGLSEATLRDDRFRLQCFSAPLVENNTYWPSSLDNYLMTCSKSKNPSLRELTLALLFEEGVKGYYQGNEITWPPFHVVRETLTKLEFQVDCDEYPDEEIPEEPSFYFGDCIFPYLTHFKVQLDYNRFYGKLFTFDLNDLKKMPLLREFQFGSSNCVEEGWVTRKLGPVENNEETGKVTIDDYEMPHLKSFHFHGNFEKEALQQLGRIMGKLETLELVLDQENCLVVKDIWPRLQNLKVLPCSDVPDGYLSNLKNSILSLNVVDESKNWVAAKTVAKSDASPSNL